MTGLARRSLGAALGLMLDRAFGEPPPTLHPVAAFGRVMRRAEAGWWHDSRGAGATYAGVGVALGATAGAAVGSTALATGVAVAGRALGRTALGIAEALDAGDLDDARCRLPALVGRDVDDLDEKDVARAAVESVAENLVDAVVAPAFWATVGGAPAALAYRGVNTMDALVGHHDARHERFGWASARLDDAANWVPARLTAALVAAARPRRAGAVWQCVRRDALGHPSPNAGVAEAAFAAALDVRLGGPLSYGGQEEIRPALGDGRPPETADIGRAVRLATEVTRLLGATLVAVSAAGRRRRRPR